MEKGGYVYIMTNRYRGTVYIGVTSDLPARVIAHRDGKGSTFTSEYGLTRLVYMEHYDDIEDALRREKAMKKWLRDWKIELIEKMNPDWNDLFDDLNA